MRCMKQKDYTYVIIMRTLKDMMNKSSCNSYKSNTFSKYYDMQVLQLQNVPPMITNNHVPCVIIINSVMVNCVYNPLHNHINLNDIS